jgi:hypothetical protein
MKDKDVAGKKKLILPYKWWQGEEKDREFAFSQISISSFFGSRRQSTKE